MNLNEIEAKCFIMALFIRDDGLRFLLGSGAYEFKDSQLMFAGNTIENDVVSIQGNDGYMLAGQVRRPSTQVFDGYIGDASVPKSEVEGYRRDFMAFFQKNHFYTVVYVMADGSAIQRRRGFLVDAPTSQELWQMYPEYHVALNFEDVNYYKYSENDDGEETYAKSADIGLAKVQYGGLIWDNNSEIEISGSGTNITLAGTMDGGAIESVEMYGDTEQTTYSGKNKLTSASHLVSSDNGITVSLQSDGSIKATGTVGSSWNGFNLAFYNTDTIPSGQYTFSIDHSISSAIAVAFRTADNTNLGNITIPAGSTSATGTISGTIGKSSLWVSATTGTSINFTIKAQLESGSQATSFEPYVGGTASPNPDYPQEVQTVTGEQTVTVMDSTQGKNIWKLPPSTSTVNNVEYTPNEDGTFDLVGLASADTEFSTIMRADALGIKEGETYTFSSNGSSILYFVFNCDVNGTWKKTLMSFSPNNSSVTSTCPSLVDSYVRLVIRVSNGTNINQTNVKSMLEKGNQATPFVPYAIQTYPINLGKNLFDKDNANTLTGCYVDNDLRIVNTGSSTVSICYIKCEPNTTYTVQKENTGTNNRFALFTTATTPAAGVIALNLVGTNGAEDNHTNYSITTPANAKYLGVFFAQPAGLSTPTSPEIMATIQIEKGSTATTYAPYFTPIELCKIGTYQDYIYKSGEDWYVHKDINKVLLDGTQYVTQYTTAAANKYRFTCSVSGAANVSADVIVNMSDKFVGVTRGDTWDNKNGVYQLGGGIGFYWDAISAYTTAQVQTWLSNNNVTAYYPLATPTDTQITNATLISELEGLLSATTYSGNTYITVSGDLASPLEVKAITIGGGGVVWDPNGAEWEEGGGGEIVIVNVDSIENILPVWTIRGEAENPTLTNLTTGMSITYNGTVASGQTLVIDLLNKTAKLNGTSVISDVSGQWVEFKPGNNRVSYSTENANAPDSTIEWQEVVG